MSTSPGVVVAVSRSPEHGPHKETQDHVRLLAGLGVEGDAHSGDRVRHRSRARRDPELPNLRQVHLIGAELHEELAGRGFEVAPGRMGENVTTRDVDLLALPAGTRLRLGSQAEIEVTGLRNPCSQLDGIQQGLMAAVLDRTPDGGLIRRCGVMAVVRASGEVRAGDPVVVSLPADGGRPLEPV